MTRAEILSQALSTRDEDVLSYQINIDNYTLAIAKIEREFPDDEDLVKFKAELQGRLAEEKRQQLRCRIIRDVIADQLTVLEERS